MKRLLFLLLAFVLACAAIARTNRPSEASVAKVILFGTIYDPNHSVIPYAQIVAQSPEGKEYWSTANDRGAYGIELPSGRYKVEANSAGFCPLRVSFFGERLQRPLDFVLEIEHEDRVCRQKSMIRKEQPKRKKEFFRSIAE